MKGERRVELLQTMQETDPGLLKRRQELLDGSKEWDYRGVSGDLAFLAGYALARKHQLEELIPFPSQDSGLANGI